MRTEMTTVLTPEVVEYLITESALRLADEETVRASVHQVKTHSNYPTAWEPNSLAMGLLGNATLFLTLHGSGIGTSHDWKNLADELLESCAEEIVKCESNPDSLFGGLGGALLTYVLATVNDPKWRRVAKMTAENFADQMLTLDPLPDEGNISDSDYDIINGRAGALVSISIASQQFPESNVIRAAQNQVFDDIYELLCRGKTLADTTWIHPLYYPHEDYIKEFPSGYFNMGVAHGLPGLLIALTSANVAGRRATQRLQLITGLAKILLDSALKDGLGLTWPSGYSRDRWPPETTSLPALGTPNAWCYGAPGVAVALSRAGQSLGDKRLIQCARVAMQSALNRTIATGSLESISPTFCHGLSGILACSISVLGLPLPRNNSSNQHKIAACILSKADEDYPLIFQDLEEPDQHLDNPTVIQGAAGIALTLTLFQGKHHTPGWQNLFGLK